MVHPKGKEEVRYMFLDSIRPEALARLREQYPRGTRVSLIEMNDPYRDMPPGLEGEVLYVDDAASIHVAWSNGSSLAVIYGVDRIEKI